MTGGLARIANAVPLPRLLRASVSALRAALRDYARALADRDQPGATAFPKAVFELDRNQTPLSAHSAAIYFQRARARWALDAALAREGSIRTGWLKRMHEDVMLAHQLEREAIERLERDP